MNMNQLTYPTYFFFQSFSETYHMIDRCDSSIATWSAAGDNFVVKNVEKFASVRTFRGIIELLLAPELVLEHC